MSYRWRRPDRSQWMRVWLFLALTGVSAQAGFPLGRLPDYQVRFRLTPAKAEDAPESFYTVTLDTSDRSIHAPPGVWSEYLEVTDAHMHPQSSTYPNANTRNWPARILYTVNPAKGVIRVEVEARVGERSDSSEAELVSNRYGSARLGFAVLKDGEGKGRVMTLGTFNQRQYWDAVSKAVKALPDSLRDQRPSRIVLADEFRLGDHDARSLRMGLAGMREMGMNAIYLVAGIPGTLDAIDAAGYPFLAGAVYQPPAVYDSGGAHTRDEALAAWAAKFRPVGMDPRRMSLFVMSDEPGWYYPSQYEAINASSNLLAQFHAYLREQGLRPKDVGAADWAPVRMIGRSSASDLPSRRLFYWSQRFVPYLSTRFFARCTRALQDAFYPELPVAVNWNFFAGRCYFAGGFGNNPGRNDPNSAMAGHEWFEFGRLGGASCMWTEDWFGDAHGFQWSFLAQKLHSVSTNGVIGGYIVPRVSGGIPDGLVYKTLALAGHGAKRIKYFAFGPEYEFPGNCWSHLDGNIAPMVKATRLVGAAESLLFPGRPVPRDVGLLHHLSSQMWDPPGIVDATNTDQNRKCAAYTAELYDLHLALMHAQVPVEFVGEEEVMTGKLDHLKVLYVTAPHLPEDAQRRVADWVRRGGVLFTTSRAASLDRYHDPCDRIDRVRGVKEEGGAAGLIFGHVRNAAIPDRHEGELGAGPCVGTRGTLTVHGAEVVSRFSDGSPAATRNTYGKGIAYHAAFLPGISYYRTFNVSGSGFPAPTDASEAARAFILAPILHAGIRRPVEVDRPYVEAPVLVSDEGIAVTLLNWTGRVQQALRLRVRSDRPVRRVASALGSPVTFTVGEGVVEASLDLESVDVLLLYY